MLDGAKCLGLDHCTGSLETGKQADIIMIRQTDWHLTPSCAPAASILLQTARRC